MTDENEKIDEAARWYYSEIMGQLLDSERFTNWFQCNFEVHRLIDEEEKSIEIRVLEIPPELVQERMQALMVEKMKEESAKQESEILIAQPGDVKQLEQAAKARRKKRKKKKR